LTLKNEAQLHLFPFSLPDELHASQISRFHRDSGNAQTTQTYLKAYEAKPFRLTQWIPTYLDRFAAKFSGSIGGNALKILRGNTLFPLLQTFCGADFRESCDDAKVREQLSALPKRLVGSRRKTYLCVLCLLSDREEHHTSYIHRSHQAPCTSVCWKHETRLIDACPRCHFPFEPEKDLILAAWAPCPVCQTSLTSFESHVRGLEVSCREVEIAKFNYGILKGAKHSVSREALTHVYRQEIADRGFLRRTQLSRVDVTQSMEDYYGVPLLSDLDIAYKKGKSPHWFAMCSSYAIFEVPLSRHILLANFLYRTPEKFLEAAESFAMQPRSQEPEIRDSGRKDRPTLHKHQRDTASTCTEIAALFKQESSSQTRLLRYAKAYRQDHIKQLWRDHSRVMKAFTKENPQGLDFLQREIESSASELVEGSLTSNHRKLEDDVIWAKAIVAASIDLYSSTEKPVKVTKLQLLKRSGWGEVNYPNSIRMPMTARQLESVIESDWHYWARRVVWAILTMESAPSSLSSVRIRAGVEHTRGIVLAAYFADVPSSRVIWAGKVMEVLQEFGVDRAWVGPTPERKFQTAGRGYQRRELW